MEKNFKTKLRIFWEKHKAEIILTGGILMLFVGHIGGNIAANRLKQKLDEIENKEETEAA